MKMLLLLLTLLVLLIYVMAVRVVRIIIIINVVETILGIETGRRSCRDRVRRCSLFVKLILLLNIYIIMKLMIILMRICEN